MKIQKKISLFILFQFLFVTISISQISYGVPICTFFSSANAPQGNGFNIYVTQVVVAGINNTTGGSEGTSQDYRTTTGSVTRGSTYSVTLGYPNSAYLTHMGMWADWNDDGDFSDADEVVRAWTANTTNSAGTQTFNMTVPAAANLTSVRLRVMNSNDNSVAACGGFFTGENEEYELVVSAALPVEFSFFKTEFVHDHVKINWQTTTETNNDYFIIERSTNGNTWENVDRINGAKNSTQVSNYRFDDKNPYLGTSYYRLKQMDIDGKYTYSEIKTVNVDLIDHDEIHINPNPTTGFFTIEGDQINIADIEIFDINGKDVTEHVKIQKTENDIHVDLEILNDGVYILKVKDSFSFKIDKI